MNDPYEVLGVSPNATDDEVRAAYREMARKYHPDNYAGNPLSDLAKEKMQEINEAYDTIVRLRKGARGGQSGQSSGGGSTRFADVRRMIAQNRILDAEQVLDGVPADQRDAEWHFLKASVLYKKGWLENAYQEFDAACRMDPDNAEYRTAYNQVTGARQNGGYWNQGGGQGQTGCSCCDICAGAMCLNCLCDCCRC